MLKDRGCFLLVFLLSLTLGVLVSPGSAAIYFAEDFESYKEGDEIVDVSDWIFAENATAGGMASKKQALSGEMSAVFDRISVMGVTLGELNLPGNYVVSVWFYHDSKQDPQPDCVAIMGTGDGWPGGQEPAGGTASWLGIGTRSQALNQDNYAYRDKTGTGLYEDTGVARVTGWVNFIFVVEEERTTCIVEGNDAYENENGANFYANSGFEISRDPSWGEHAEKGEVFVDDVVFADTVDEALKYFKIAVEPSEKLASTWGNMKVE